MSVIFEINDKPIWNPGLNTGHLFYSIITEIGKYYQCPTGIVPTLGDTFEIEPGSFKIFVERFNLEFMKNHNMYFHIMLEGVFIIIHALYYRIFNAWANSISKNTEWQNKILPFARSIG